MRVTLKKAAALAAALSSIEIAIPHTVQVSAFDDAPDAFDTWGVALREQIEKASVKWTTVYQIRSLIGQANEGKINSLLTERAAVEKLIAIYGSIPSRPSNPSPAALSRQFEAIRNAPGMGGRNVNVPVELETASIVDQPLDELKARKRVLDDELAALNHEISITLPDDVVTILRDFKLI
jgi:hypothetical protein